MAIEGIAQWGDVTFAVPATTADVHACEAQLGHPPPPALVELLANTNGIEGEYGLGLLWPTQRIAADNRRIRSDPELTSLYM